jgi:hypothetical protein
MAGWFDRHLRTTSPADVTRSGPADDSAEGAGGLPGAANVDAFVITSTRPEPDLDTCQGEWLREEWPCPRVTEEVVTLEPRAPYVVDPSVGVDAWIDCAGHLPWGQSLDQRHDDALSLTWDRPAEELVLLGYPMLRLRVSADQPVAHVAVKLCDVFPDGASALVSRGTLNLTHRAGHTDPTPLTPDEVYEVEVELDACAHRFTSGQRMRVVVAGADWPNTAAPPTPTTLTVHGAELVLPRWRGPSPYQPPTFAPGDDTSGEDPEGVVWRVERDVLRRTVRCVVDHGSTYDVLDGAQASEHYAGWVEVDRRSFAQAAQSDVTFRLLWPEGEMCTHATLDVAAGAGAYAVDIRLEASARDPRDERSHLIAERHWQRRIPRDLT